MATRRYDKIISMFGKRLRLARERAGYTSAQRFAEVLGLEPHTYRHYERGESEPNFETFTRMCELLDVTPNDLLPFSDRKDGDKDQAELVPAAE